MLIAGATNLGLTRMAEACGVPYDVLAWTQEWYVREDTLREANTVIVNCHHSLELTKVFGGGIKSSHGGLAEVRAGHRIIDRREVVGGVPAEHSGGRAEGVGNAARIVHAAKHLTDPAYRRKIARQLNKGESLHALRRDLHYAQQGTVNWSTEYCSLAVKQLRAQGRDVPDELLAHISSARNEDINFFGVITSDVEEELARLDPAGGWRPLHPRTPGSCGREHVLPEVTSGRVEFLGVSLSKRGQIMQRTGRAGRAARARWAITRRLQDGRRWVDHPRKGAPLACDRAFGQDGMMAAVAR